MPRTPEKPAVIVYRDNLLPPSETFVLSQAESLERFTPYYAGSRFVQGLSPPAERTVAVNRGGLPGKASEISYKLSGFSPAFRRRVRALNPRLIHAHFGPDGARVLSIARQLQIPLLVTFHGYDATVKDEYARRSFYSHRVYVRRRERLKREAGLFIAVSEFIKVKLLEQGFPPDKVVVRYVGVDTSIFRPDPSVTREPVVLFVGRLVEKKGCQYLLEAMSVVQARMPNIGLTVIGDGPLRPALERAAAEKLGRYRFLGAQPSENVRAWMNRAAVFSVPSVVADSGDSEAFGIAFAEAQAMGLPVVSFSTGGIPEAVSHGETGFLAAERDWKGLAEYIARLLEYKALRQKFGERGRERVQEMFDLQAQTRILEDTYEAVLRGEI